MILVGSVKSAIFCEIMFSSSNVNSIIHIIVTFDTFSPQIDIIAPGFFYWALFVQMCCISFIPSKYVTEVSSGCISYNYFLNAVIFVALCFGKNHRS